MNRNQYVLFRGTFCIRTDRTAAWHNIITQLHIYTQIAYSHTPQYHLEGNMC
jgi:hypothetical protein